MVRRTISLPNSVDEKLQKIAEEEGSYSAAVARVVEDASRRTRSSERPSYIGSVDDPSLPRDLALNYEQYMKDALKRIGRRR